MAIGRNAGRTVAALALLACTGAPAVAQTSGQQGRGEYAIGPSGNPVWAEHAAAAAQAMPILPLISASQIPATIPVYQTFSNTAGSSATYQPGGPTVSAGNPFFQALGTNGRTCASCHLPGVGWSITPPQIQALFFSTGGTDPLFQPVDGANCSNVTITNLSSAAQAYSLLLNQGLIRIFEKVSATPQYTVNAISDPYNCNTNAATGLTSYGPNVAPAGFLSVYRRPLPAANLNVLSTILADGRETTLQQQAIDANRIHAQATTALTAAQAQSIVTFESGLYAAQTSNFLVGDLTSTNGATGGPVAFSQTPFYLGINDPFGGNPASTPFNENAFNLYASWQPSSPTYAGASGLLGVTQQLIAAGEKIFNTTGFTISGVTGLNDTLGVPAITGTCAICHDTPNAGTHSLSLLMDTGTNAPSAPGLNVSALPVFTLQCTAGTLPLSANASGIVTVTDPGRATLSGQCADIGRVKVLTLRNLAQRPPYFHNGSAATLANVVQFYNSRFGIGLSGLQQLELEAFLASL